MKWWRKKRELFFQMNDLNNEEDEELFSYLKNIDQKRMERWIKRDNLVAFCKFKQSQGQEKTFCLSATLTPREALYLPLSLEEKLSEVLHWKGYRGKARLFQQNP